MTKPPCNPPGAAKATNAKKQSKLPKNLNLKPRTEMVRKFYAINYRDVFQFSHLGFIFVAQNGSSSLY